MTGVEYLIVGLLVLAGVQVGMALGYWRGWHDRAEASRSTAPARPAIPSGGPPR